MKTTKENFSGMPMDQLVDRCIYWDTQMKSMKSKVEAAKAELQSRGQQMIDDRLIKYYKLFGAEGTAVITETSTLDVLNLDKLRAILGSGLLKEKLKETTKVSYKFDLKLERALKAIFTDEYSFEYSLDEFLDEMQLKPNDKQKKLLLKKLKGEYKADKNTLLTVLGYMKNGEDERTIDAPDLDVELYYICRIKNAELIRAFLPEDDFDNCLKQIKTCIMVETKNGITLDYKEED